MAKTFEDFPVYKKVMAFVREVERIFGLARRDGKAAGEFRFIRDQIRRAASSILLNVAEGSMRWGKKDKINFYRMGLASACECIAAIDLMVIYGLVGEQNAERIKHDLREIVADLQALLFHINKRPY
jgi:four helix bundle protein